MLLTAPIIAHLSCFDNIELVASLCAPEAERIGGFSSVSALAFRFQTGHKEQVGMRKPETKTKSRYTVRRVQLGRTAQLDELAHACGQVYNQTLLFFWRTVRHKGIWLKPRHLMRLIPTDPDHLLHAHSVDATVQAFFAGLSSWRERRSMDPSAKPPRRRKWYFKVEYKRSAMRLHESLLILSNGRGNAPLVLFWQWELPQTVVIHWTGSQYEAIATYQIGVALPEEEEVSLQERRAAHTVGIDLGEVHPAVSCDGERAHLLNGRLLRSKRQYRNKLIAKLDAKISRCKQRGKRRRKLILAKKKCLSKLKHQIQDIEHKLTSYLVNTLHREGVEKLVIGDVRTIRHGLDKGSTTNQKLHQWGLPTPLAASDTSSPIRRSVWGCASWSRRRATPHAPVRCVVIDAKARQQDACFGARTKHASGRGTAMEWEPQTSAPSIVANLVAAT